MYTVLNHDKPHLIGYIDMIVGKKNKGTAKFPVGEFLATPSSRLAVFDSPTLYQ